MQYECFNDTKEFLENNFPERNFTMVDNDIIDREDLDLYEKMVYLVLLRHRNSNDSKCFPSYKTIAAKAGCSERKAISTIKTLQQKGLILKQERKSTKNKSCSNFYILHTSTQKRDKNTKDIARCAPIGVNVVHPKYNNINNKYNNLSISQMDRQVLILKQQEEHKADIEYILENIQVELYTPARRRLVVNTIEDMYYGFDGFAEKNKIPISILRSRLKQLDLETIDCAIWNINHAIEEQDNPIKNKLAYFKKTLWNSLTEASVAEIYYA